MAGETTTEATTEAPPEAPPPAEATPPVEKPAEAPAPAAPDPNDWRAMLTSDDAKKFAETSPDLDHLVGRALEFRQQLSTAVVLPGKDATDEQITAYRKQIGVPETADAYEIAKPEHLDDAAFKSEPVQATLGEMRQVMHEVNLTNDQVQAVLGKYWALEAASLAAQVDADKQYAEDTEKALRDVWRGTEYDKNKAFADRAAEKIFGDDLKDVRQIETKEGRFVLDHPALLKALAVVGREMAEGGLVPPMSDSEVEQADTELRDLRDRIGKAQARGDTREANRLYQQEQELIAKSRGNQAIVGAAGRAA